MDVVDVSSNGEAYRCFLHGCFDGCCGCFHGCFGHLGGCRGCFYSFLVFFVLTILQYRRFSDGYFEKGINQRF